MANIDLGTFTFDAAAVDKQLETLRKRMFELKNAQSEYRSETRDLNKEIKQLNDVQKLLINTGAEETKTYKDNEKAIASLTKQKEVLFKKELETKKAVQETNKEYKETTKVYDALTNEQKQLISSTEAMEAALNRETKSIEQARASNKELLLLRNKLDLSTDEGVVAMERFNDKLNENNQFIKENVSGYEQQKINIGNYESALEGVGGRLGEFLQLSQAAGGVMPLLAGGVSAATTAIGGMTKAGLAFIATPLGAAIAVLAGAFLLIQNALNRSEESTNKLKKAMAPLSGIFNALLSALEPLGEFLIDGLVAGFELATDTILKGVDLVAGALQAFGFEDAAKGVLEFKSSIDEAIESSKALAQAEADLEKAQRQARLTQLEYQKEAEELRQIRDDDNLTIQERIQANEELGNVLNEQLQVEKDLAQQALLVANLRIQQEGETKEALDAQYEALTEIADIEERIAGQRSEQLTNRNSLEKEALDIIKERQDAAIEANEQELELMIAMNGFRRKSSEEQIEIAQNTKDKELEILEQKYEFGKVSETEYQTELINIQNQFLELQRDLVIENAEREREALIASIESKKTDYAEFTQAKLDFEIEKSQALLESDQEFAQLQREQGVINEEELQFELQRIRDEARIREDEARLVWEEANNERELLDAENQRIIDEERFINEFELRAARLEQERQQEIAAAEQTGADITLINKKYAIQQEKIEAEKKAAEVQMAADTYGAITSILGEQSGAAKGFALAQALINTYQGISAGVALGFPAAIPAVAAATATGFGAVKNITKTKAEKGYVSDGRGKLLTGNRHSSGGIQVEAEDGEPILTRGAWKMFPELISNINVAGGGVPLMARGGVAGNTSSSSALVQRNIMSTFDMTQLSETISEGVKQGAMEGSATGSAQGSQQGLVDLSDNREIQNLSTF